MLSLEKGVLTAPGGNGNQTYNLGSAFSSSNPLKAILLWATYETAAGSTDDDGIMSIGMGTDRGGTASTCYTSYFDEGTGTVGTSSCARGKGTAAILKGFSAATPTVDYIATLDSFTDTSFTINWTDFPTSAIKVNYLAIGGSDVTDALVSSFNLNTTASPTTQDITVVSGFGKPDFLIFLDAMLGTAGDSAGRTGFCLGMADGASTPNQVATYFCQQTGSANMSMEAMQRTSRVILLATGSGAVDHEVSLTARSNWPTDGFQINKDDLPAANRDVYFLALKGIFTSEVGENTTPTSISTKTHAVGGGTHRGGIFWGTNVDQKTTLDTSHTDLGYFWLGASDGTTEGGCRVGNDDGNTNSISSREHNETKSLRMYTPSGSGTLVSEADCVVRSQTVDLDFNDADSTPRAYCYAVFADASDKAQPFAITRQAVNRAGLR